MKLAREPAVVAVDSRGLDSAHNLVTVRLKEEFLARHSGVRYRLFRLALNVNSAVVASRDVLAMSHWKNPFRRRKEKKGANAAAKEVREKVEVRASWSFFVRYCGECDGRSSIGPEPCMPTPSRGIMSLFCPLQK